MLRNLIAAGLCLTAGVACAAPGSHFIENWDLDGNGEVSLAELQERRGDVFVSFDANDDGILDAEEYTYFDEARANDMAQNGDHGRGGMRRAAEGMSLSFNDLDKDGVVSLEEFSAQTPALLTLIDRDGSGAVTSADFGRK